MKDYLIDTHAHIDMLEENVEETISNLNKTLEINPKDVEASKLLTQIYLRAQNYEKAQEILNSALEQNPYQGDLYYYLAKTYPDDIKMQEENLKKALENYKTLTINAKQIKKELRLLKS